MCLAVFHFSPGQKNALTVVANRDEFRARSTQGLHQWDGTEMYAGKDLEAGGTWLGVTTDQRFALLTNIRPGFVGKTGIRSRGELVTNYLLSNQSPQSFHQSMKADIAQYAGFNLIIGNPNELYWFSSVHQDLYAIPPGTHALSNDALNTPWPKAELAKSQLESQLGVVQSTLTDHNVLQSVDQAAENTLPNTGVPLEWESKLSAQTITGGDYGTRSRTHVVFEGEVSKLEEQSIDAHGEVISSVGFTF